MDKKSICKAFIADVSGLLDCQPRCVEFVAPAVLKGETQAALTPEKIMISDKIELSPELFFAIAHELRHAWQIEHGETLEGYKSRKATTSKEYNLQPLEVDANAYALLIMRAFFGIEPKFESHPQPVREAIFKRVKAIEPEFIALLSHSDI